METATLQLLAELDTADGWPAERWAAVLDRTAKLFLCSAEKLSAAQIDLFDGVVLRLLDRVDTPSLARLSQKLSETKYTLPQVTRRLALDASESVWAPILKSPCIPHGVPAGGRPIMRARPPCRDRLPPVDRCAAERGIDPMRARAGSPRAGGKPGRPHVGSRLGSSRRTRTERSEACGKACAPGRHSQPVQARPSCQAGGCANAHAQRETSHPAGPDRGHRRIQCRNQDA